MKKFLIISIALVLVAATVFSLSLYHYLGTNEDKATADEVAPTVEPTQEEKEEKKDEKSKVPAQFQDGGIFSKNYEKAYEYMQSMSKEQMVGQLIIGTCPTDDTATNTISRYALGGYFFNTDNFYMLSQEQIKDVISSYQSSASTPMIMSVEEEGGAVTAISDLDAFADYDFDSPRNIFEQGGMDAINDSETKKATMLSSVGINLNIAPVCDTAEEFTQIMYSRSLGGTIEETAQFAQNVTNISQKKGVSVALKHFPGYGTIPDSVESVVKDTREASSFGSRDFVPFQAGIDKGAHCVLMSNVLYENMDPTCVASLSDYIHTILRNELKFTGLIVTDNLNNADYSEYANGKDVYVQAVLAGNDMLMVDEIDSAYTAILEAVNDGTIKEEVLQKACMRVIAYKYTAGIMK